VTPNLAPVPIVLDVDTGVDDACALLFAARHPGLDLRAVTCVAGNADVDQVVHNTLTVLDAAGAGAVPVAKGADRPLLEPARDARHVHGEDGMGDLEWPRAHPSGPIAGHAVELLRDTMTAAVEAGEKVTLVPLAPLTNIALFLRTYPHAAAGLGRVVFMGGSAGIGNATAAAEFNVWHDPDAAAVVLSACHELGVPVTMYGLDVFYDVTVSLEQARELSAGRSGTAADLAGRLVEFSCGRRQGASATIGDAGAVCAVVDPAGLTTTRLPVRVELAGTWTRGRTVVDSRTAPGDLENDPHGVAPAMVEVALAVDGKRYADLWLDTMRGTLP
jgi:pyrimidine-specific ribonucleoside hydrolase